MTRRSRYLCFGLATAVALGLAAYGIREHRRRAAAREKEAIEALRKYGAQSMYFGEAPDVERGRSDASPNAAAVMIEIDDPTTEAEDFRSAEFAVFRTMSPKVRITVGNAERITPLRKFQVTIDDADDSTNDALDISRLFVFANGKAVAVLPELVPMNHFPGGDQEVRRLKDGPVRVTYFGENRVRFRLGGREAPSAYFLAYNDEATFVGPDDGDMPSPKSPSARVMRHHIILHFEPGKSDAALSRFLLQHKLRPQGISKRIGLLQVRDPADLSAKELLRRVEELDDALGPEHGGASLEHLTENPALHGTHRPHTGGQ